MIHIQSKWWMGVVEDRLDPDRAGRVRVRIYGIHSSIRDELPTEKLPWCPIIKPTTSGATQGIGQTPMGIVEGDWVTGFFVDGASQQPVVVGVISGMPQNNTYKQEEGFRDVRPSEEPEYDGQLTLFDSPRKLAKRELATDGTGALFTEENGKSSERTPQKDGRPENRLEDKFLDKPDTNILAYRSDVGEEPDIVTHKKETIDTEIPLPQFEGADSIGGSAASKGASLNETANGLSKVSSSKSVSDSEKIEAVERTETLFGTSKDAEDTEDSLTWSEPETQWNPTYPFNHVHETESGHVEERDDTPAYERLHKFHRTGTFEEIHPDGSKVYKIVGDDYTIVLRNQFIHIESNSNITIDKAARIYVNRDGDTSETEDGESNDYDILIGSGGNVNMQVNKGNVNTLIKDGNSVTHILEGNHEINVHNGNQSFNIAAGNQNFIVHSGDQTFIVESGDQTFSTNTGDLSLFAGNNLNIEALSGNVNVSGQSVNVKADANVFVDVDGDMTADVGGNLNATIAGKSTINSVGKMSLLTDSEMDIIAGGNMKIEAPRVDINP